MEEVRKGKKGAGRPAKAVRKEVRASIRFTKAEYFIVRAKAAKASVKVSAYLREIAIHGQVKPRLSEEERQFVRQLIGMANNLNQLTKKSHQEGILKAVHYFEGYRGEIDLIIQKLKQ